MHRFQLYLDNRRRLQGNNINSKQDKDCLAKNWAVCPDKFEVTNMATYKLVRNINHPEYNQQQVTYDCAS